MAFKSGSPTKFNFRIAAEIIQRIMNGEAVCSIVKDSTMPANSTLYKWIAQNPIFAERYAQALEFRTHLKAEERHEIINDAMKELEAGDKPEGFNYAVWGNLVKEKIRAVEWDAERLAPVKYKIGHTEKVKPSNSDITINFVDATKPDAD